MPWITAKFSPGFSHDHTTWRTVIERDGTLVQLVQICRVDPKEERLEEYGVIVSSEQIAELDRLIACTDFDRVALQARIYHVDDIELIEIKVEDAAGSRVFGAPLQTWNHNKNFEAFAKSTPKFFKNHPEYADITGPVLLWEFIESISPYGSQGRNSIDCIARVAEIPYKLPELLRITARARADAIHLREGEPPVLEIKRGLFRMGALGCLRPDDAYEWLAMHASEADLSRFKDRGVVSFSHRTEESFVWQFMAFRESGGVRLEIRRVNDSAT
jgi:hypothetical protein